jgi:hypothetical protein
MVADHRLRKVRFEADNLETYDRVERFSAVPIWRHAKRKSSIRRSCPATLWTLLLADPNG